MAQQGHELTVWWDGSTWRWTARHGVESGSGTGEDSLDARLSAMEWVGQQDRPPVQVVLKGVARVRREYLTARPIV